jgi:hypothetical protein
MEKKEGGGKKEGKGSRLGFLSFQLGMEWVHRAPVHAGSAKQKAKICDALLCSLQAS